MHEEHVAFDSLEQRDEVVTALRQHLAEHCVEKDIEYSLSTLGQHISFAARQDGETPRLEIGVVFETKCQYEQCIVALKSASDPNLKWLGYTLELPTQTQQQYQTTTLRVI